MLATKPITSDSSPAQAHPGNKTRIRVTPSFPATLDSRQQLFQEGKIIFLKIKREKINHLKI